MFKRFSKLAFLIICSWWIAGPAGAQKEPAPAYDLLIRNGHIVDGTGSPWYSGDVGIRDGRIAAIGNLAGAHAARRNRRARNGRCARLHRHARTVRTDHPGRSAPAIEDLPGHHHRDHRRRRLGRAAQRHASCRRTRSRTSIYGIKPDWRTLRRILRAGCEKQGIGINLATYVAPRKCGAWCWATRTAQPTPARA